MRIAIFGQHIKEQDFEHLAILLSALEEEKISYHFYEPLYSMLAGSLQTTARGERWNEAADLEDLAIDYLLSLGGDGTILSAVTFVRDSGIPVLGINLGRLGFLAIVEKKFIRQAVQLLSRGMFSIESRTMLYLESSMPLFGEVP